MRILVTGGFGFIGGRVASHLIKAGHQVLIGTRSMGAPQEWISNDAIVSIDWRSEKSLNNACKDIDVVVHAAGMNSKNCEEDPQSALEFNGKCTGRLAAVAANSSVSRFIYLSTAHVYASPLEGCFNETSTPNNSHPYAISNLAGEGEVCKKRFDGGMRSVVLRISNAFGLPMDKKVDCWGLLINDLCRQAAITRKISLRTDGSQCRDFIVMDDLCKIIEFFCISNLESGLGEIFNVGSGNSFTVLEIVDLIRERCNATLGFRPHLSIGGIKTASSNKEFIYKVDLLKSLNINQLSLNFNNEIDQLLCYCKNTFDIA